MKPAINLLLSITRQCNLECSYCYVTDKSNEQMSEETLELITRKALEEYSSVVFVWHGTEPTLRGLDFFQKARALQNKYGREKTIINQLQTNLTFIDQQWIDFIKKEGFSLHFSYDGKKANDETRSGSTAQVLNNLRLVQAKGIYPSCNVVVSRANMDQLIEINNELTKDLNVSFYANPLIDYHKSNLNLDISPIEFAVAVNNLFDYWFNDHNASETAKNKLCESLLTSILRIKGEHKGRYITNPSTRYNKCTFSQCYGSFLGILEDGSSYPCDNFVSNNALLGNIHKVDRLSDLFQSKTFAALTKQYQQTLSKCKSKCEWYELCYAGCPSHNRGDSKDIMCAAYTQIFSHAKQIVDKSILRK